MGPRLRIDKMKSAALPEAKEAKPAGGYVWATVVSVFVHSSGSTELTIENLKPDGPA